MRLELLLELRDQLAALVAPPALLELAEQALDLLVVTME
jgi:hypothetical protein